MKAQLKGYKRIQLNFLKDWHKSDKALMILVEFMPILFGLSIGIPIFFFGDWDYGLIVGALIWSVGGTVFLIILGLILRLAGVEYDLQKRSCI